MWSAGREESELDREISRHRGKETEQKVSDSLRGVFKKSDFTAVLKKDVEWVWRISDGSASRCVGPEKKVGKDLQPNDFVSG